MLLRDIFKESHPDVHLQWIKNGEEAVDFFSQTILDTKPTLIILDLNMPKLNGNDVLSDIRNRETSKHIPVVMFSNSSNRSEALHAYQLGLNSFVRKPAGYNELREFVQVFYKYWFEYSTLL